MGTATKVCLLVLHPHYLLETALIFSPVFISCHQALTSSSKALNPQELQGVMQKFQEESLRMEMADEMSKCN